MAEDATNNAAVRLAIVVPCYNEEEVLPETCRRLAAKLASLVERGIVAPQSRVLFVNDGSRDATWSLIKQASLDPAAFGIAPDAGARLITWTPHTPIGWEGWEIERLRVGEACFDVRSERISPSQARYTLRTDAAGWQVAVVIDGEEKRLPLDQEQTLVMGD